MAPWTYRSSDGLGLHEFLLWAEHMNAEPVLGVYAGYSLKGEYVSRDPISSRTSRTRSTRSSTSSAAHV